MDRRSAVRNSRNHLPQRLGPHVTHGIHAGDAGFCGFSCNDVAALVQFQLLRDQLCRGNSAHAYKYAIRSNVLFFAGLDISNADTGSCKRAVTTLFH